uniref:Uncharacterized protein n=1 Tax=Arundo donax TaxID=35708 RepID=A0A0A9HMF0_ARUDO
MSTYITRPFSTLPFISSLALLASSWDANFTKPNPFGLLVTLSVTTVAFESFC